MRAVWWSVAALSLLAVTSALRTTQVEGASRSRRLPAPISSDSPAETSEPPDEKYTIRPRTGRRREELPARELRTRTRSRSTEKPDYSTEAIKSTGRNERFDSRRTQSRSRSRNVEIEKTTIATNKDRSLRNRARPNIQVTSTALPLEVSSPSIDETKIEVINSNLEDLARTSPADGKPHTLDTNSQFKRRSSTIPTIERVVTARVRSRINTRPNPKSLDLEVAGTTNSLTDAIKEPTTARSGVLKKSRKLRYKTRLSESDTNLTGEGLKPQNDVIKSSQSENNVASQPEMQASAAGVVENSITQQSTESLPEGKTASKITNGIKRRPLVRGKINFRPSGSLTKSLPSDEISEDDNYPPNFKALIQAKNASTQPSSPQGESLSVKASQKVYKTYTASSQSTNTGTNLNKYTRLRSKLNADKKEDKSTESVSTELPKAKNPEFRPRGSFTPRNRKLSSFSPSTTSAPTSSGNVEKSQSKYRRFQVNTTESPHAGNSNKTKRTETNVLLKKSARSSYYQRKSYSKKNVTTEKNINLIDQLGNDTNSTVDSPAVKSILPRTSYYSRLRNKKNDTTLSTTSPASTTESTIILSKADKKNEDTIEMPLIFTLLKNSANTDTSSEKMQSSDTPPNQNKEMFIIAVSSKESLENNSLNDVTNTAEESENSAVYNTLPTTIKYHANYRDFSTTTAPDSKENMISSTISPVKNIPSRKYGRKFSKTIDEPENEEAVVPKPREKYFRKYSEPFSKTTEASTNGISVDPEKYRGRFSSKYRGPHAERPIYKATVPTVTTSTAWLKFFITDQLLTKSLEEPNWFEDDDLHDVRTESMSRQTTMPPIIHKSSLELVEGEEIDLGPDMNAISFTKPRSKLSSADLRLSESVMKPSHIMNVEATHHSPSVTVSIFDALADILTSTPRTRLSTTTEVMQKQNTKNDVNQIFNGVSNINVNSVGSSPSQDTLSTSADINTSAKTVQATDQTTPIVINRLSVGEGVTPSLNNDDSVNTPQPASTPTPTTPVSARKPFAIRVLYSDTEPTVDKFTTSTVAASIQPPTDSTMVYNTVSDLLLSNNNLVSSELTSMLSNNIRSIIQNMDESSRSRITSDMAELLKTLIPRAIDRLTTVINDVDSIPSTTPYSLEDIKDTENVDVDNSNDDNVITFNIFQSGLSKNNVNSTLNSTSINNDDDLDKNVNSTGTTQTNLSVSSSQTTVLGTNSITDPFSSTTPLLIETSSEMTIASNSDFFDTDKVDDITKTIGRSGLPPTDTSKDPPRVPFLTNFRAEDFNLPTESTKIIKSAPLSINSSSKDVDILDIDDPSQISKFQLWVLSKKARVLKMIEELILQHNDELATAPPLTDMISQSNNIPLSDRLTKIITNMGLTTETIVSNDDIDLPTVTFPDIFVPLSTSTTTPDTARGEKVETTITMASPVELSTISSSDIQQRLASIEENKISLTTEAASQENIQETTVKVNIDIFNRNFEEGDLTTVDNIGDNVDTTTLQDNTETTTNSMGTETTTEENIDITTQIPFETTITNNVTASIIPEVVANKPTIPKKDYVIFGILPNNTVVRKDPNDNVLESLTEASPYIVYGVLPNNTVIRKFPNGTRVPRVMQKIDVLPISPWSLKNPYSPIHNNPAIVRPQSNLNRVSSNIVTSTDASNNGTEKLTSDTIPPSALNIKDSGSLGITTATNMPPAEKSTASHVLSLRTTTMLPSVDEILLNSISSATKEEMVKSSMTSSTSEPRILTLDIDPETKEIRTEKPGDGTGNAVFKFIPIDEVNVAQQNTNVLKLATKPSVLNTENPVTVPATTTTQINTQIPQIQSRVRNSDSTTTASFESDSTTAPSTSVTLTEVPMMTTESLPSGTLLSIFNELTTSVPTTTALPTTTLAQTTTPLTTTSTTMPSTTTSTTTPSTTTSTTTTTQATSTEIPTIRTTTQPTTSVPTISIEEERQYQQDALLLEELLRRGTINRNPKNLNTISDIILNTFTTTVAPTTTTTVAPITTTASKVVQRLDEAKLLQALLGATDQKSNTLSIPSIGNTVKITSRLQTTTSRSIEDDIRQFEEDTKLLKALLQATGQNPDNFNIPTLNIKTTDVPTTTTRPTTTTKPTTTTTTTTTTTPNPTTTTRPTTTTQAIDEDIRKLQEDTRLLQALLQNRNAFNNPVISGVTSNVRIASNPLTTSLGSNPTTPVNVRPVYTSRTTTPTMPTFTPRNIFSTFDSSTTENIGISTTFTPFNQGRRVPTTASVESSTTLSGRRGAASRVTATTEMPSTSTFSVEEDLAFLKNLKTVLKTNTNSEDPEAALANRIIALAVERSLNEIESTSPNSERSGKKISNNVINNAIPTTTFTTTTERSTTTMRSTTTTRPTTTTSRPTTTTARPTTTTAQPTTTARPTTTVKADTPSLEDDLKQFQEDTKLLQALLQATGQDPSKFNIPTLPQLNTNPKVSSKLPLRNTDELQLLANIFTAPVTTKSITLVTTNSNTNKQTMTTTVETTTARPFGAKIAVKGKLKTVQNDEKLLKTLVKLQDVQEATTQRNKLAITGQSSDEALKKLLQSQQKPNPSNMMSQATQTPMSLSTEFGKSNDALLAALLKEQGFGPTTASSLDEQLRLSALLNQVVVTPKARRTTTPPPPPPLPRRPILDGIAWLWQQWRETAPGPTSRPSRRPSPSASPAVASSAATSNRVNWFGSGPFVGNADDQPTSNRVPLEPPRVVTSEQTPGRGQLVSAAINVTRAFSQFLGAAIQGAAQTVQSVIRAGQRAATDVYVSGSGGSG